MAKPLKVLHLVEHFNLGGIEKLLELMAEYQGSISCRFYYYTYMTRHLLGLGSVVEKKFGRVFYEQKSDGYDVKLLKRLIQFVRKNDIKVIHTHDFGPMEYAVAVKFFFPSIHLIHTQHSLRGIIDQKKYLLFFGFASFFL